MSGCLLLLLFVVRVDIFPLSIGRSHTHTAESPTAKINFVKGKETDKYGKYNMSLTAKIAFEKGGTHGSLNERAFGSPTSWKSL